MPLRFLSRIKNDIFRRGWPKGLAKACGDIFRRAWPSKSKEEMTP